MKNDDKTKPIDRFAWGKGETAIRKATPEEMKQIQKNREKEKQNGR